VNYLLDTNIISAVAPTKKDRPAALVDRLDQASDSLYLSVVTAAEIRDGIAKLTREGAAKKAKALATWWNAIEHLYATRILPFDLPAATIAGRLTDVARARGQAPGFADVAIAAIAQEHNLTILTSNIKHFEALSAVALNPLKRLPPLPAALSTR
jgi:predicted nucleic acid-binding protein